MKRMLFVVMAIIFGQVCMDASSPEQVSSPEQKHNSKRLPLTPRTKAFLLQAAKKAHPKGRCDHQLLFKDLGLRLAVEDVVIYCNACQIPFDLVDSGLTHPFKALEKSDFKHHPNPNRWEEFYNEVFGFKKTHEE